MNRSYPSGDHDLLFAELGISSSAKILDVGGGGNPFKFAEVVVDMDYSSGNSHRDGSAVPTKRDGVNYVQADIQALPFKNNAFDFVICLHVVEHVDSPGRACDELMRVAKSGFLETPRKWTEYYAGHPTHRWLVDSVEGCLTFEPVTYNNSPFLNFVLPPLWDSPELQKRLFVDFSNIPCVQIVWNEEGFKYRVEGCMDDHSDSLPENLKSIEFLAESHYCFAKNLLLWMGLFETGAFHAETALKMVPTLEKYQKLYLFYRLITIEVRYLIVMLLRVTSKDIVPLNSSRLSLPHNPTTKLILAALLCRSFRFLTLRMLNLFRKMVAIFI